VWLANFHLPRALRAFFVSFVQLFRLFPLICYIPVTQIPGIFCRMNPLILGYRNRLKKRSRSQTAKREEIGTTKQTKDTKKIEPEVPRSF